MSNNDYDYSSEKLLIANRGEIAVRIIRTAKKLGLRTVAVYTPSDATSEHVRLADEAAPLPLPESSDNDDIQAKSEGHAYLSPSSFIDICKALNVTLLHPGYGFLSESAELAALVAESGVTWLGPKADVIHVMGTKHEARQVAMKAGVPIVPGSEGLVAGVDDAVNTARQVGYPVILKATAGGGGMGMVVCQDESELREKLAGTVERAKSLFGHEGVFLERYFNAARHIEIQVFGNGLGDVVHMAERECSVQRRHQKVIEESPSPFLLGYPGLREAMCDSAVQLCRLLKYNSAGTVEFIVDDATGDFFFLEMNTRVQVEHPVTEELHPGLDLIQLTIEQGMSERRRSLVPGRSAPHMCQDFYDNLQHSHQVHVIEGRVYAENPAEGFVPSPGLLQYVELCKGKYEWLRIDSWVETGVKVTPFFDPLLCKIIVTAQNRNEAMERFICAMEECKISGPPNNMHYLKAIVQSDVFRRGQATTQFLNHFTFTPKAFKVISSGIDSSIQDLPGRTVGFGVPRSGPMDFLAFKAANLLVGNPEKTESLEVVTAAGVKFSLLFFVSAVVAVTGKYVSVSIDGVKKEMWSALVVPAGATLTVEDRIREKPTGGFRVYIAFKGGFPSVPTYLGSKSTSMGLGGYQGRSLMVGDQIQLGNCEPVDTHPIQDISSTVVPPYPRHWIVYVLSGPHDNEDFLTPEGINMFYKTHWRVSSSSNRLGIRLEADHKIEWARSSGGEGGSHPSNILDNGYAPGTINVNGNTPVILTNEGPDMGGYVCLCTVATADLWKLGQIAPGNTIQFCRVSWDSAMRLQHLNDEWLQDILRGMKRPPSVNSLLTGQHDAQLSPILAIINESPESTKEKVVFRQAGDSGILVEFGDMKLDLFSRARIHAFEQIIRSKVVTGTRLLCPCIRSILCLFDSSELSQRDFLNLLLWAEQTLPESVIDMEFRVRRITFPIVLDDHWNREALERYMRSTRDRAVYLPSNVEYLARNNGLSGKEEALQKLVSCDWIVLGIGFYLACPFLVPLDPRCQLVGQKMNPSRTYTPRGAIGLAGPVAAIYPIESPGGYQLYGRTLPAWQTWGKGEPFQPSRPWLLQSFDQVHFEIIEENAYQKFEQAFDSGLYKFKIEDATFSMADYKEFLNSISRETSLFEQKKEIASAREEKIEIELLTQWESEKQKVRVDEGSTETYTETASTIVAAPLFATIWRISCRPGQVIESGSEALVILEAMKTEIPINAGDHNIGKIIHSFGKGVSLHASVQPGDALVHLM